MVTSDYQPSVQAGNGVILAFSGSYKILAATDLVVSKIDAAGNSSGTLILGTDYTVTFDPIAETWTVTYTTAPVTGGLSRVARDSNSQQQTSLPREGNAPAKTVETMIDKLTMLVQETLATLSGSPTNPVFLSGLYSDKPANPAYDVVYTSIDRGSVEMYVVAAGRWILVG